MLRPSSYRGTKYFALYFQPFRHAQKDSLFKYFLFTFKAVTCFVGRVIHRHTVGKVHCNIFQSLSIMKLALRSECQFRR